MANRHSNYLYESHNEPSSGLMTQWLMQRAINHMEEFAAAYLKHTNLPPDQVVMKVRMENVGGRMVQTIWFEKKEE